MEDENYVKIKQAGIKMSAAKAAAINKKAGKTILVPATEPEPFVLKETPIGNRIIILEDKAETKTAAGIYLPNAEKPNTGVIVAAGPECTQVKLGNQVRYHPKAGESIMIDGTKYLAARETEIYTILNK